MTSSKSPSHSPNNTSTIRCEERSLTLEQFTEIVLAQERLDKDDIPMTVEEVSDKRTDVTIANKTISATRPTAKLKPVVLTPRHAPPVSPPVTKTGNTVSGLQMREQMRKQLEFVIKKNEEILESSNVTHAPQRRGRAVTAENSRVSQETRAVDLTKTRHLPGPLNLSVRKDLMKPKAEPDKVNIALEKLLARHGNDLEITRKSKKERSMFPDSPPDVTLKPQSPTTLLPRTEHSSASLKRSLPSPNNNVLETKKYKPDESSMSRRSSLENDVATDLSILNDPANQETVKKIMEDCRVVLQQDVNGNW